ncbi:hypothetical protein TNCV_4108531 [Trichonephila clavipes]|nr:hypothetical protein TNCV_4108531 [Trichonephila clavipes]
MYSVWHGGTLNSRRDANPLVRLVKREEKWEPPGIPLRLLLLNWGRIELNHTVTCMVLKPTANGRCTSRSPACHRLWQLSFPSERTKTTTTSNIFRQFLFPPGIRYVVHLYRQKLALLVT